MKLNDRIFGLGLLVIAIAYGTSAFHFPEPFAGSAMVGPGTFPKLLAALLGLCSLYLIFRPDADNPWPSARTGLELVTAVVVLLVYTVALVPLGFIISTTLAVGTLIWRMGAPPVRGFGVGLAAGLIVYFLFTALLNLPLPAGPLTMLEVY